MGKVPGRILVAGGPDLEEEELEGFSLQVQGEEEGTGMSSSEEEDGPGPPLQMCLSFGFPFFWRQVKAFSLFLLPGGSKIKESKQKNPHSRLPTGIPPYDDREPQVAAGERPSGTGIGKRWEIVPPVV